MPVVYYGVYPGIISCCIMVIIGVDDGGMTITRFCQDNKLTYAEFADLVGVDRVSVWRYRTGRQQPTLDIAMRILHKTGYAITIPDLMRAANE